RLPGGREDDDVVIARAQSLGELADVHLHPARIAPGVRTGQRDAHQPASSGHAGSNTCQSAGDIEIMRSKASATAWVIAVASARRSPVRSGMSSGQTTPCQPLD